jgi:hypothetical protein
VILEQIDADPASKINSTSRKNHKKTVTRINPGVQGSNLQQKFLETVDLPNGNFSLKIRTKLETTNVHDPQVSSGEKMIGTSDTRRMSHETQAHKNE